MTCFGGESDAEVQALAPGQISFSSWAMSLGSPSRQRNRLGEPSDNGERSQVKK